MMSAGSFAAVMVLTLSQLFVIFKTASRMSLFASEYIPHEVIKKLSIFTFLPVYMKTKMKVMASIATALKTGGCCKKKEKVEPKDMRRASEAVNSQLGVTAGDILGRQLGEDFCFLILTLLFLPITQQHLFPNIYPASLNSSSLLLPSYTDILICIVGIGFVLENIMTVIGFALLIQAGVPLASSPALKKIFTFQEIGMYICNVTMYMMILIATFYY